MKLMAIVICVFLLFTTKPFWILTEPTDENIHKLEMTVLCDKFGMYGDFGLKFKNGRPYPIWSSRKPVPINFKNLHLEAGSIKVDGKSLDIAGEKVRIEAQEIKPRLYIYRESNIHVHEIYISKIMAATTDAEIEFYTIAGETYVSIGRNSIIELENKYSSSEEWIIEIEGKFQIIGDKDYEVMEDKKIRFSGALQIEGPELPNSINLRLAFDFFYHMDEFQLDEGHISFESGYDSSPNKFMAESYGAVNEDEVIEDGFRIDMTNEFYQTDRFLGKFCIGNVCEMKAYDIKTDENRLSIKSDIDYIGETIFPKVKVTTKYFLITKDNTVGDLLVEISNLETGSRETVTFLDGREYLIEICIDKLVNDDIVVDFIHRNFQEDITKKDFTIGHPYKKIIACLIPSFKKQPIECYTDAFYRKRNKDSPEFSCKTESFYVEIQSEIIFEIEDIREEIFSEVKENDVFLISKRIILKSEISDSIEVKIFLVLEEGFKIEKFGYNPKYFSKKDDYIDIKTELRVPHIGDEKEEYEIKIFFIYNMNNSTDYKFYLPGSTTEATIVENITVKRGFQSYFSEWIPMIISFIFSGLFSYGLQYEFISKTKLEEKINKFFESRVKDGANIKIIKFAIKSFIFVVSFVIIMTFIAFLFFL